jgi:protein gp37
MLEKNGIAFFQWGGRNKKAAGRELEGTHHDSFPTPKKRRQVKVIA